MSVQNPLVLSNLSYENAGDYFCFGTYEDLETHFLAKARIHVSGKIISNIMKVCFLHFDCVVSHFHTTFVPSTKSTVRALTILLLSKTVN